MSIAMAELVSMQTTSNPVQWVSSTYAYNCCKLGVTVPTTLPKTLWVVQNLFQSLLTATTKRFASFGVQCGIGKCR